MRLQVEIDRALLHAAMDAAGAKTQKAAVEAALNMFIRLHDPSKSSAPPRELERKI